MGFITKEQIEQKISSSQYLKGQRYIGDEHIGFDQWCLAEEVPVSITYNTHVYAMMMLSPVDLKDFAKGFSLTEGIVSSLSDILVVKQQSTENGLNLCIAVDPDGLKKEIAPTRKVVGAPGCGICGSTQNDILDVSTYEGPSAPPKFQATSVLKAFEEMPALQVLNQQNKSLHAAAFCDAQGHILLLREDIGRHNALDKLIGALMKSNFDVDQGFIAMTSRCSFELVKKSIISGVSMLATLSAPTALAIQTANKTGLHLAVRDNNNSVMLF